MTVSTDSSHLPPKEGFKENLESHGELYVEVEHIEGTVRLFDRDGRIRNIPVPTDDPADPLTWPSWKRWLIMGVICLYGIAGFGVIQSPPLFFAEIIGEYMKQTHGQFNVPDIVKLSSLPSLMMGAGNFLFVPLSMMVGRRTIFILNNIIMFGGIIWAAQSTDFNSHLGARCLQGLSCGISDCLLPIIVLDITFLHRRGFWMSFYWAITAAGSTILLVAVPFVVAGTTGNWRTNYWFWLGFSGTSLVFSVCLFPETFYPRAPALIDGQLAITDSYGHVTFVEAEATSTSGLQASAAPPPKSSSLLRQYLPVRPTAAGFRRFYMSYVEMALALTHPAILWVLILNTLLFAGVVIQSLTYTTQLELPTWGFSHSTVGTVQAGSFIGALLALLISGGTADKISSMLTRRNNGIREPEHLLPNFVLPSLLAFAGLVLYGVVAANPAGYPGSGWIAIHFSFGLYFCGFVALSAITGVWIGEVVPHWSGPVLVLVCGGRNAISYAISNNFTPWITSQGFANAYIEVGSVLLGVALVGGVLLFLFNKSIRRVWGRKINISTL